jgi:acyl-CoA thioesterase-1
MNSRWRSVSVLAVVVTAAVALGGCVSAPSVFQPSGEAVSTSSGNPVVVAIGDSIMKGHGLSPSQAWPELIGKTNNWKLTNLACDGAGFSTVGASYDCDDTLAALVEKAANLHPDIVLISGSSNDLGIADDKLSGATIAAMKELRNENPHAKIVGISTVWGDTLTPAQIDDINDQVRGAVDAVGGIYLDIGQPLAGHRDWLQADDVHPTAKGQRVLANAIRGALRSAKIIGQSGATASSR